MDTQAQPQILLSNDDGINSPGLWAAAEALSALGFVTVVAPRDQCSSTSRSKPATSDGVIHESEVEVEGNIWNVYAVGGTPAQAVEYGILEIMPRMPDLVVAGINYGENIGSGVTISGTVGAALEGAAFGVPSLAVSLATDVGDHLTYSEDIDFSTAAYFTGLFAGFLLTGSRFEDVDVLKVEVPSKATRATPWRLTRLSRIRYYAPVVPKRNRLDEPSRIDYEPDLAVNSLDPDTDTYALHVSTQVSVTPLSLDLTSRVDLTEFEKFIRNKLDE